MQTTTGLLLGASALTAIILALFAFLALQAIQAGSAFWVQTVGVLMGVLLLMLLQALSAVWWEVMRRGLKDE